MPNDSVCSRDACEPDDERVARDQDLDEAEARELADEAERERLSDLMSEEERLGLAPFQSFELESRGYGGEA